ncbi:hypothetical protein BCR35DRAFT_304022 [Leucosporidium creatinivorum]|uniref:Uncharacterized protein n=1 Tax=Leucosporidium creatinivorum TaxID=106004 RepID=A0A1Y2FEW6_9BASI|nr:hypothetical protein BCR35DRAFT_304022 [Leucosporidium creatinivorum]
MLRCIPRLKAECTQCLFLGWVDAPTSRSGVQVKRDIAKYRDYASLKVKVPGSAKTATVGVDGIFFDSVSPANVNAGRYTTFSEEVHTAFRSGGTAVLNPGEDVPKSFYSNADLVTTYYGTYRAYTPPKNNAASFLQQIVIIHSFPTKFVDGLSPTQRLLPLLDDLKKQVAAVFVSDFQSDLGFAFNWKAFTAAVAWRNQKVENSAKKERREVVFAEVEEA